MDPYINFNRKQIDRRQVDTLIGLCKGLVVDGVVSQGEADALRTWLIHARSVVDNPPVANLLTRVDAMLVDGRLDPDESTELLSVLRGIAGTEVVVGELQKPSTLPLDQPPPAVVFPGKMFVFTGTCAFGTRAECTAATVAHGGAVHGTITKHTDFLVLGTYVTDSWIHETYGRKIEKAMQYRDEGLPLAIVSENQWVTAGSLT